MSPERRRTLCASLRSRNACQDFTRATLYGNLQEKRRRPKWAQNADEHFVRACAVETHVKISQEPLYTEIYRKNAAPKSEHPDQAPAFTLTVRTPQCGHPVWGKKDMCRWTWNWRKPSHVLTSLVRVDSGLAWDQHQTYTTWTCPVSIHVTCQYSSCAQSSCFFLVHLIWVLMHTDETANNESPLRIVFSGLHKGQRRYSHLKINWGEHKLVRSASKFDFNDFRAGRDGIR